MPVSIQPSTGSQALAWADYPADYILVMVFVILLLASFRTLMGLLPYLLDSVSRWKACISIDASIRLKSDRNLLGLIWLLPLALIADRYSLFSARILDTISPQWHVFATVGIILCWLFLRFLGYALCHVRTKKPETLKTAHKCIYNYIILFAAIMAVIVGIFSVSNPSDTICKQIVLYGAIAFYLLALLRESQTLGTFCSQFRTFLYLCALEIIPTGALIAGNILF